MTFPRQLVFWIGALVLMVACLYVLRGMLLPFVAGLALAYFFDPVARRLERLGMSRLIASLLMLVLFILVFVLLVILVVPLLAGQLTAFLQRLPDYVTRLQNLITDENRAWLGPILGDQLPDIQRTVADVMRQGAGFIVGFITNLWSGGAALLSVLSIIVVTPVVAFYILYDWDKMIEAVDRWLPLGQKATIRELAREIDRALAGFVRGQAAVCLILGSFYAVSLTVVGLNFGLLIGMGAGLLGFIPYVGSLAGLLTATGVGIVQFWPDWPWVAVIAGIFLFGQLIEAYWLYPKLVGASIGLHPVWLMFALFAFGYLFGFVGLLLAVPLAAAVGVLSRFALKRYLASSFYTGQPPPADRTP